MLTAAEVSVMLNVMANHPRQEMPFLKADYERYFSRSAVPPVRVISDINGNPNMLVVNRDQALNYLKARYGFHTRPEVEKKVKEDYNARNSDL